MERQNITLTLSKSFLKRAKSMAASKDKSLNQFLEETLEKSLRTETNFKSAKRRQLALLKQGFDLGTNGHTTTTRKTLYDRKC